MGVRQFPEVVVIGDVMTDVAVRTTCHLNELAAASDSPASITLGGGGAGGNVASWLAHLGVRVGLVAVVGGDPAGATAVERLRAAGVLVARVVIAAQPTGTVVALVAANGERTMITDRGANALLAVGDLPNGWFRADVHLHVSGYTFFDLPARDAARHALALAAERHMTSSVDPASWAPLRRIGPESFLSWTAAANHCLPNADEASLLAGTADLVTAAERLGRHYGQAVVTGGARGAIWSDGANVVRQPAAPGAVVDTTGAGDAFTAGYLTGVIEQAGVEVALRRGVDAARSAIGRVGARPG